MIDDPSAVPAESPDARAKRLARADTHIPTVRAAGARRAARPPREESPTDGVAGGSAGGARLVVGGMMLGAGLGGVLDSLLSHYVLGLHHVNERVPPAERWAWDAGALALAVLLLLAGLLVLRPSGPTRVGRRAAR